MDQNKKLTNTVKRNGWRLKIIEAYLGDGGYKGKLKDRQGHTYFAKWKITSTGNNGVGVDWDKPFHVELDPATRFIRHLDDENGEPCKVEFTLSELTDNSLEQVTERIKELTDKNKHHTTIAINLRNRAMMLRYGNRAKDTHRNFGAVGYRWILEKPEVIK